MLEVVTSSVSALRLDHSWSGETESFLESGQTFDSPIWLSFHKARHNAKIRVEPYAGWSLVLSDLTALTGGSQCPRPDRRRDAPPISTPIMFL
jgi:hypothetical protein